MVKILAVYGTRPEAIKMSMLCKALTKRYADDFQICNTGQHSEMIDTVNTLFDIQPNFNLKIMREQQTLNQLSSNLLDKLDSLLAKIKPNLVLVHGDTHSAMCGALAAYNRKISVGHIEAGLRSHNRYEPWPEELNRKVIGTIANYHFAPTNSAAQNLIKEAVSQNNIWVTGNTVIDSLLFMRNKIKNDTRFVASFFDEFSQIDFDKRLILVTGHRRENFGQGFENICNALIQIAKVNRDVEVVYPVHLNPEVRNVVYSKLSQYKNIHLLPPLSYTEFIFMMDQSYLILTDSGGIQEEAPSMNKPVLVMRDVTERPEAVQSGTAELVGSNTDTILTRVQTLLNDTSQYKNISNLTNPFGDGSASQKILAAIETLGI